MKKVIVFLSAAIAVVMFHSPSSHSAVMFTAGSGEVASGSDFSVAITVSSDLAPPSTYWGNAGFNLVWDESVLVLQATPVDLTGSPLPLTSGNFFSPNAGQLNFNWIWAEADPAGWEVPDSSTLFTVNFTAIGEVGNSTTLSFASIANIGLTDAQGGNFTSTTPTGVNGLIGVVPEPVNYALGSFAVIVLGTAGVRWVSSRRKPRHPLN